MRLIDADALVYTMLYGGPGCTPLMLTPKTIAEAPTVEAYSAEAVKQIMWERDMAIQQLSDYGVQFGEKADCVRVVRCKDCMHFDEYEHGGWGLCTMINDGAEWRENDFCSYGNRRDGD